MQMKKSVFGKISDITVYACAYIIGGGDAVKMLQKNESGEMMDLARKGRWEDTARNFGSDWHDTATAAIFGHARTRGIVDEDEREGSGSNSNYTEQE